MTTFALVHGGAHGGWCWELLVPELERRGHRAIAPDLPIEDEKAGASEWADTVVNALSWVGADDNVVVVGHSLAGLCIPLVASKRPVRRMVFLGAMVPVPGRVFSEYLDEHPEAIVYADPATPGDDLELSSSPAVISWAAARHNFYQDLDEPVARRAWERLRPNAMTVFSERCPLDHWPQVPSTYILMTEDHSVNPAWSRAVARDMAADLVELPGSHSPFYSRPGELADVLVSL